MKRALSLLLITSLLILGIQGIADAVTPSGPGQTTAAHSVSVVFASDASLPTVTVTGGATAAKQDTGNTSLSSIDGKITACNTGAVVVSSSGLPSGAATSAAQTTAQTSLSSLVTNTTSIATAANQTTANSSLSTIATNTTSIATAANQTTANSSLSTIATNTTSIATAANQTSANTKLDTLHTDIGTTIDADLTLLKQPTTTTAVTISDSTNVTSTCTKGVWVGTGGNLAVKGTADSSATTWKNVPSGTYVPGAFARIMSTNTTAADIVCLSGP